LIDTVATSPEAYESLSVEITYEATVAVPTRTETADALIPVVSVDDVFVVGFDGFTVVDSVPSDFIVSEFALDILSLGLLEDGFGADGGIGCDA